jgi:hypothetical protein
MANFRHGQWIKFETPAGTSEEYIAGAHKAKDGKLVGIYQKGTTDTFNETVDAHVVIVKSDGTDVMFFDGTKVNRSVFAPHALINAEPLLDNNDLPPGRVVRNDFELRP